MPSKQGGAGSRKYGRNKDRCSRYRNNHVREKNKVRRVLRASGVTEARAWAKKNGVSGYLDLVVKEMSLRKSLIE